MKTQELQPRDIFAQNQILTFELAKKMIGQSIAITSPEYHANIPAVRYLAIAGVVNEWDHAFNRPYDYPEEGYKTWGERWEATLRPDLKNRIRNTWLLLGVDGHSWAKAHTDTYFFEELTFTGSDADRPVYYTIL